jgi:hypothetical protein
MQDPSHFQTHSHQIYRVQVALQEGGTSPNIIHSSLANHHVGGGVQWVCRNTFRAGLATALSVGIMSEQA